MKVGQVYRLKKDASWTKEECEKYGWTNTPPWWINIPKDTLFIIDKVVTERPKIYKLKELFPKTKFPHREWICRPSVIKENFIREKAYEGRRTFKMNKD